MTNLLRLDTFFLTCALVLAAIGGVLDARSRRIPNYLTYSGFIAALGVRSLFLGWAGLRDGLIAALGAGGLLFILFIVRGLGAGDVKLMAAVSAWAGKSHAVDLLVGTALAGGILAVVTALYAGRVGATLRNTVDLFRHHLIWGLRPHPILNIDVPSSASLPFGPAIAVGTAYSLARSLFWG